MNLKSWFIFLSFAVVIFINNVNARTMFKIKCYTPSAREDRTELAKYIHLDMITNEYVVSIVNEMELKELKEKTNLSLEVLSSFDTDKSDIKQSNLNSILILSDSGDQTIEINQSYISSSKTDLEIDLQKLLLEKNPLEKRNLEFSLESSSISQSNFKFDANKSKILITPNTSFQKKTQRLEFTSSAISLPVVKIILEISYL